MQGGDGKQLGAIAVLEINRKFEASPGVSIR